MSALRQPSRQQATGKEKLAITRRIYAKSHMIADVRGRICMPHRSAGVCRRPPHPAGGPEKLGDGLKVAGRGGGRELEAPRSHMKSQPVTERIPAAFCLHLIEYESISLGGA